MRRGCGPWSRCGPVLKLPARGVSCVPSIGTIYIVHRHTNARRAGGLVKVADATFGLAIPRAAVIWHSAAANDDLAAMMADAALKIGRRPLPKPGVGVRTPSQLRERNCSVARTLSVVSDAWSFLVIREAFFGARRFESFRAALGIPRATLTDRLRRLTQQGIFRQVRSSPTSRRAEYRLTKAGLELYPSFMAMMQFGDRWLAGRKGPPLKLVHTSCGCECHPIVACSTCHEKIAAQRVSYRNGPGAGALQPQMQAAIDKLDIVEARSAVDDFENLFYVVVSEFHAARLRTFVLVSVRRREAFLAFRSLERFISFTGTQTLGEHAALSRWRTQPLDTLFRVRP